MRSAPADLCKLLLAAAPIHPESHGFRIATRSKGGEANMLAAKVARIQLAAQLHAAPRPIVPAAHA